MANKRVFKSNNVVYSCKDHVIWCSQYRHKVLANGVDTCLKAIIQEVADELCCEVLELEVMADPVHFSLAPLAMIKQYLENQKGV